jgi:Endosomal/lysosomal potassium channel TMEM175
VRRDTGRLVAFSDGVFAITITLLVLEIKPPEDGEHLLHGLLALWPSYLAYAVTFPRPPSAGASSSPWPGSRRAPCSAPSCRSSGWS